MGSYLVRELSPHCENIFGYDKDRVKMEEALQGIQSFRPADSLRDAVKDAEKVIFCVPTESVEETMTQTLPYCKKGAIISGETSRKAPEARAFDKYIGSSPESQLEMVTLHTLCNPSITPNVRNEILGVIRHHASDATYDSALAFYSVLSDSVEQFSSIEEHDITTGFTQINASRCLLSIGSGFARAGCFPWLNQHYQCPFDAAKFSLAMRIASGKGHVYKGIQFGSPQGKEIVRKSIDVEHQLFNSIISENKDKYQKRCRLAREYVFGNENRNPIMSEEDLVKIFGPVGISRENSDLSLMQWLVSYAELKRKPGPDLKAATPLYRGLLCLVDHMCMTDRFEAALDAPFRYADLRADDLVFDREITGWSDALLYENETSFDARHKLMCQNIDEKLGNGAFKEWIDKSKPFVASCRNHLDAVRKYYF